MTATCVPSANGRTDRRSLSAQIDRFDKMLDGLDSALLDAVKEAVAQSTSTAVAEAVRSALLEIAANPNILAMLQRASVPAPVPEPVKATADVKFTPIGRIGNAIAAAWKFSLGKLKSLGNFVAAPVRATAKAVHQVNQFWSLRRPVLIALAVGIVIGTAGALSSPWLAGLLSGCGAAGTTLGAQFVSWSRRLYASFGMS
ncbi:MAG: hypothetical protein K8T89_06280 [Planctomycetes bacterium]|nr:hypothetical protein [Planctomycetota bacterium]